MSKSEVWLAAALVSLFACGDDGSEAPADFDASVVDASTPVDASIDAAPPDADVPPAQLSDTGLYSDIAGRVIAEGVEEYEPAYPLWSDGAVKRRWVYLPPGSSIDTSDMDFWVYPEGTKLWKEFKSGDTLLETRLLWKRGATAADWYYVSYGWNAEQSEAIEMPNGAQNVLGTDFDIPEQRDCRKCHQRQPDFSLGFTAIQLAHTQAGTNLDSLIADSRLSVAPVGPSPYYAIPGTSAEQEVLGYLHGNCGGCHHKSSDVLDTTGELNMRMEVGKLGSVAETTAFATTVGIANLLSLDGVTALIEPGDPNASAIYVRMNQRGNSPQMPPRGTEVIDSDALTKLSEWITGLPQ